MSNFAFCDTAAHIGIFIGGEFPLDTVGINHRTCNAGIAENGFSLLEIFNMPEQGTVIGNNFPVINKSTFQPFSFSDIMIGVNHFTFLIFINIRMEA